MSKLFSCDYPIIHRNVARWDAKEEMNQEKDDGFWFLRGIFNEYIKQNIITAELRKLEIDEKSIMEKKIKKLIQALIFF